MMGSLFKKTGYITIFVSLIFLILGILLICYSDSVVAVISYVIGGIFVGIGTIKLVTYFTDKASRELFSYNLAGGIVAVIFGICIIAFAQTIVVFFRIIISIWIIYSGIVRLNLALELKKANANVWKYVMLMAVIMLLIGLLIMFYEGMITTAIGIIMVVYSVLDIIEGVIYTRNVHKLFKEIE